MSLLKLAAMEDDIKFRIRDAEEDLVHRIAAGAPLNAIKEAYNRYLALASSNPEIMEKETGKEYGLIGTGLGGLAGGTIASALAHKTTIKKPLLTALGIAGGATLGGIAGYFRGKHKGAKKSEEAMQAVMSPPSKRYAKLMDMLNTMNYKPYY